MTYSTLDFAVEDHVATITINRPEAANAMNLEFAKELLQTAIQCDSPHIRAIIITGAGKTFSVGGDLKSFAENRADLSAYFKEITTYLNAAFTRLNHLNAPLIAAVNGAAAGAG